jgi:hypothetical protein
VPNVDELAAEFTAGVRDHAPRRAKDPAIGKCRSGRCEKGQSQPALRSTPNVIRQNDATKPRRQNGAIVLRELLFPTSGTDSTEKIEIAVIVTSPLLALMKLIGLCRFSPKRLMADCGTSLITPQKYGYLPK